MSESIPRRPGDSLSLGPDLTMVCRPRERGTSWCDMFGVATADDRRVHWLIPQATQATRDTLQRAIELETEELPQMSTVVTAHTVHGRSAWFGLGGGFPEGDGAFGGLLHFDGQRRTVQTFTHPKLANATVTDLAIDGDALWIGTLHPGEYGPWGSTGVLRRQLRNGAWTQLDSATTDLPDDLIQALAAADGVLYVATSDGLAAYDAKSRRWNVRYFRRTIIADTIVYALATARPTDEVADETTFLVMEALRVKRRGAFMSTMRQIGLERLSPNVAPGAGRFVQALAHPALMPFLLEALAVPETAGLAAAALAEIGDRQVIPALHDALSRSRGAGAGIPIATALAQLGDSAGFAWLHDRLRDGTSLATRRDILQALANVRATISITPILAVLAGKDTDEDTRRFASSALAEYRSPALWRRMVDVGMDVSDVRRILVADADSIALSDSAVAGALGGWALELLDAANPAPQLFRAITLAARLRPHDAVPPLMRVLAMDQAWAGAAARELVRLTGIDSAPPVSPWRDDGRRLAQEFWGQWWRANATGYRIVPREVGERAYRRWEERVTARERLERQRSVGRRG